MRYGFFGLCLLVLLGSVQAQARDTKAPSIQITQPTRASSYSTTATQLTIGGTARDPGGGVTRVTWQTSAGGSGTATGRTSWSFPLTLTVGTTTVTVTAFDAAGNTSSDSLTVTVMSPPPPPGPITVNWIYDGTGDAFQIERCTVPCGPMAPVATLAMSNRSWTDTNVAPDLDYCYRMAVLTGSTLGSYSNIMCSP
jgi:hypothetical protein